MNISSSHRIVRIQGKDSLEFLQGQLSNDLKSTKKEYLQKNAICNIKGRIIALLWVNKINDESFDLIVDGSIVEKTFETLKKYKVFYKSDMVLLKDEPKNYNILKTEDWKTNCIKDGICEINSSTTEIFTPHDLGYQNLEIINFEKGCFTGQEVIARMHYRAKLKSSLCIISSTSVESINEGDNIYDGNQKVVGKVASKIGEIGLIYLKNSDKSEDLYDENGDKFDLTNLKLV